jgi:hypothetical protein
MRYNTDVRRCHIIKIHVYYFIVIRRREYKVVHVPGDQWMVWGGLHYKKYYSEKTLTYQNVVEALKAKLGLPLAPTLEPPERIVSSSAATANS